MTKKIIRMLSFLVFCLIIARAFFYTPEKNDQQNTTHFTGNVMTMDYEITIGSKLAAAERHKVQMTIDDVFHEVNVLYNKWNPESELSTLNRMPAGEKRELSPQLYKLLQITQQIVTMTEGRFDPTIEPLQQIWKKHFAHNSRPTEAELQAILPAIGWEKVHFANGIFSKDHDLTSIDLGGIAKGYGVDLLIERLYNAGFSNLLVEWGGEVRALGHHPDKRDWQVVVSGFESPELQFALGLVALHDTALATSGDYFQNWKVDDTTYFHIIDPRTHHPLTIKTHSIASATVSAPSCALADGLATAALMFETAEEAQQWAKTIQSQNPALSFYIYEH